MIFAEENSIRLEARACGRVKLISVAPRAFIIEVQQRVAHGHPYFALGAIDSDGRQHTLEDWRAAALFLLQNFAADGLRFRSSIQRGVSNVQGRVAVAVVAPH